MKLFNNSELEMPTQDQLKKLIELGERDLAVLRRMYKWRIALDEGREPDPEPEMSQARKP